MYAFIGNSRTNRTIFKIKSCKLLHDTTKYYKNGVPDWNRTNDLSLRRRSLYPTELRGHNNIITQKQKIITNYGNNLIINTNAVYLTSYLKNS